MEATRVPDDLRIQLEGQLEVVEQAVLEWQALIAALESPMWARLPYDAFAVRESASAIEAVERKAHESEQAQNVLRQLRALEAHAMRLGQRRLESLGLSAKWANPRQVVSQLRAHLPVKLELELTEKPRVKKPGVLLFVAFVAGAVQWHSWWAAIPLLVLTPQLVEDIRVWWARRTWGPALLTVTRQALIADGMRIELADLTSIGVTPTHIAFKLTDGSEKVVPISRFEKLVPKLKEIGLDASFELKR